MTRVEQVCARTFPLGYWLRVSLSITQHGCMAAVVSFCRNAQDGFAIHITIPSGVVHLIKYNSFELVWIPLNINTIMVIPRRTHGSIICMEPTRAFPAFIAERLADATHPYWLFWHCSLTHRLASCLSCCSSLPYKIPNPSNSSHSDEVAGDVRKAVDTAVAANTPGPLTRYTLYDVPNVHRSPF